MTAKPRSRVEKVARELYEVAFLGDLETNALRARLRRIAKWHLAEIRRAKGEAVPLWFILAAHVARTESPATREQCICRSCKLHHDAAKRVLEPRRGTKGSKR